MFKGAFRTQEEEKAYNTWMYWSSQYDILSESESLMAKGKDVYDGVLELCVFLGNGGKRH